jgi:hypothetical protein
MELYLILCVECESPHFLVRWDAVKGGWIICCEGCGAIYRLTPDGTAELFMKGIDQ